MFSSDSIFTRYASNHQLDAEPLLIILCIFHFAEHFLLSFFCLENSGYVLILAVSASTNVIGPMWKNILT